MAYLHNTPNTSLLFKMLFIIIQEYMNNICRYNNYPSLLCTEVHILVLFQHFKLVV